MAARRTAVQFLSGLGGQPALRSAPSSPGSDRAGFASRKRMRPRLRTKLARHSEITPASEEARQWRSQNGRVPSRAAAILLLRPRRSTGTRAHLFLRAPTSHGRVARKRDDASILRLFPAIPCTTEVIQGVRCHISAALRSLP